MKTAGFRLNSGSTGISRERVGSIIHEDLDMRKLSAKWDPKCLYADQKRVRCQSSEQLLEFFRRNPNDFLSQLVTWTKPGYVTMARRQSNSHWSGGIAAHPAPKNPECKNPLENFSPRFLRIKTASSSLIILQRAKGVLFLHDNAPAHWALAAQKKLAYLGFQCVDHTLFSGSGPVGLSPVPWTEKAVERSPFLVRRGGHCCRGDLV